MDETEIERTLAELGHGTLALAREDEAYAIPVSFGYDGERVFLRLIQFGGESTKLAFSRRTERACVTAYRVESKLDWKSVVVTGTLHEVAEGDIEYVESVMDDNAWFPNLFPPAAPITGYRPMELRIEERTGLKGGKGN